MELNLENILKEMLAAVKQEAGTGWKEVRSAAQNFLNRKEERYRLAAELILTGDISPEKFKSILEDEQKLLESELLALQVIGKSAAQKAANAAIDVLQKAVDAVIGLK